MDGDHTIDKCYDVTSKVLDECYRELKIHNVNLKGTVLKPNMILPGTDCKQKATTEEIAKKTLDCLKKYTKRSSWCCFPVWGPKRNRGNKKLK